MRDDPKLKFIPMNGDESKNLNADKYTEYIVREKCINKFTSQTVRIIYSNISRFEFEFRVRSPSYY
jgi:hypothetical protein